MHYYLYEIKNNLNGKVYIGVHKTKNIDDGYMGSGKTIKLAIAKYGIENFTKVILETFTDEESMYSREKEIVTNKFLLREDVYNVRCGGYGGFDHINNDSSYIESKRRGGQTRSSIDDNPFKDPNWQNLNNPFKNNREVQQSGNTPEARKKARETAKKTFEVIKHQQGEKNSQFGTMWITNEVVNKKISKDATIPVGWRRGRIR